MQSLKLQNNGRSIIFSQFGMATPNSYLDDFMDKMVTVPNDVNRFLRLIRKLDKRTQDIQSSLYPQQAKFLQQAKELKERKITQMPPAMKTELEAINRKQRQLYGYMKEKKDIAEQLAFEVSDYSGQLHNQLKNKCKGKPEEEIFERRRTKMGVNKAPQTTVKKEDFFYDPSKEAQYCYCGRHSFGEMVACENPYCEREWFHTVCLEEKNLPEKWYCADCQKQRDKTKNPNSRSYFVNKEPNA